ncbi:MAG: glycoside hydrolase family 3 protein [Gammaproteobacteria bacterium]|nr:glycoside hydrolase family 3 protein [Gammaproteobacteria bacterium]
MTELVDHETVLWPKCRSALDRDKSRMSAITELAESRLSGLSTEQKVAQLIQAELASVEPGDVREFGLGSILNGGGVFPDANKYASTEDWRKLASAFQSAARESASGIPILWGTDAVHGHNNVYGATIYPHNIALGAANDTDLVERLGAATAQDVLDSGIDWVFAPTLAVPCDYRWGRTLEGFSQDPEIVGRLGGAMTRGLQGDPTSAGFLDETHVLATSKHFVGEGSTADGIDQGNACCSEQVLLDVHAVGHISALKAGAQVVMAAFNSWNDEKVHGSSYLLQDVLKRQMGFDGFVVSDWDGFAQLESDIERACIRCINAGVDMLMVSSDWRGVYEHVLNSVESGQISTSRLDDAARRILRVKALNGMLSPTWNGPSMRQTRSLGSKATRKLAREAVRKSLVLLKNSNALLPLSPGQNVVVVGTSAHDIGKQCGGWTLTWQGTDNTADDFPHADSIASGIQTAVAGGGGVVTFVDDVDDETEADVAIVVFGEEPYAEGEGDLNHLSFSRDESEPLAQMRALQARGIPVVALFLTGRPRWINPELNASVAFVVCWLPGTQGGAVADILFRNAANEIRHDFVGRLSYSWPLDASMTCIDRDSDRPDSYLPVGYGLNYEDEVSFDTLSELDETTGTSHRGPSYQGSYNYPNP